MKKIVFLSEKKVHFGPTIANLSKKEPISACQIPALEIHKKDVAASINGCGRIYYYIAASSYRWPHLLIDAAASINR